MTWLSDFSIFRHIIQFVKTFSCVFQTFMAVSVCDNSLKCNVSGLSNILIRPRHRNVNYGYCINRLPHWSPYITIHILQTTSLNAFCQWQRLYVDWNFTKMCSLYSYWQTSSLSGRQIVYRSNHGHVYWFIYASLGLNGLNWIDGLLQDCTHSSVLAMELLPSCTKPSYYPGQIHNCHEHHIAMKCMILAPWLCISRKFGLSGYSWMFFFILNMTIPF